MTGSSSLLRLLGHSLLGLALASCAPSLASRERAVATAWRYSALEWTPAEVHRHHGPDSQGIQVHTPDSSLNQRGFSNGWWKPGELARGMPYKWGGFDTPESFHTALAQGRFAGDIGSDEKQRLGDQAVSTEACGIDCSGLVSRCWNLPRPYSTKQLPSICRKLSSWEKLKPGDILLNHRHVLLFAGWKVPGKVILAYEAGPFPVWRVNAAAMERAKLERNGYRPWAYYGMID